MDKMEKKSYKALKTLLNNHYKLKNIATEIMLENPDPLLVVKEYQDNELFEEIALICALLSYGSARQIVITLKQLNFSLLHTSVDSIEKTNFPFYRFQTSADIKNLFIAIHKLVCNCSIRRLVLEGYNKNFCVIEGIHSTINAIDKLLPNPKSRGLDFLIGKIKKNPKNSSPLKRWNMYLRWMVRKDKLDFGRWSEIATSDLILPLDTHTFRVCHYLGILERKTYDLYAALLATDSLKQFDPLDPIKYDFALYRLGQERSLS